MQPAVNTYIHIYLLMYLYIYLLSWLYSPSGPRPPGGSGFEIILSRTSPDG